MNHSKPTEGKRRPSRLLSTVPVTSPELLLTPQAEIEENRLVPMGCLFALRLLILNSTNLPVAEQLCM